MTAIPPEFIPRTIQAGYLGKAEVKFKGDEPTITDEESVAAWVISMTYKDLKPMCERLAALANKRGFKLTYIDMVEILHAWAVRINDREFFDPESIDLGHAPPP